MGTGADGTHEANTGGVACVRCHGLGLCAGYAPAAMHRPQHCLEGNPNAGAARRGCGRRSPREHENYPSCPLDNRATRIEGSRVGIRGRLCSPRHACGSRRPVSGRAQGVGGTVKTSQASSATQAKDRLLSEQRKSPSPVQSKPKALPQNEFVTMALKAGALKQSSPLVMSEMAGNKGFDPLGFAKDNGLLLQYREAELKHARLAMLASVGWVMSELWHTPLAELLGAENLLQEDKAEFLAKAPSVLNGGLQNVPVFFWISTLLLTGAIEGWRMLSINEQGPLKFTPGQLGFDPLGFYAQEGAKGRMDLQTKELNNGRLAMLAIAFFAASEFATNAAVVDQTPGLFTEGPLANAGNLGGLLGEYSGLLSCKSGLVYCTEGQDSFTAMMSNEASNAEYINEIMGE